MRAPAKTIAYQRHSSCCRLAPERSGIVDRTPPVLTPSPRTARRPATQAGAAFPPAALPADGFDRGLHAALGRATAAISPSSLLLAYADWLSHLNLSPAKQIELVQKAWRKLVRFSIYWPHAMAESAP